MEYPLAAGQVMGPECGTDSVGSSCDRTHTGRLTDLAQYGTRFVAYPGSGRLHLGVKPTGRNRWHRLADGQGDEIAAVPRGGHRITAVALTAAGEAGPSSVLVSSGWTSFSAERTFCRRQLDPSYGQSDRTIAWASSAFRHEPAQLRGGTTPHPQGWAGRRRTGDADERDLRGYRHRERDVCSGLPS